MDTCKNLKQNKNNSDKIILKGENKQKREEIKS